jgi:hypothetical protein
MKALLRLDPMRQEMMRLAGLARQGTCHNGMQKITMQGHKEDYKSVRTRGKVINWEDRLNTTPGILDIPRPEYTAESRSLRIEGDVVIEIAQN